jgi:hypothetical protein
LKLSCDPSIKPVSIDHIPPFVFDDSPVIVMYWIAPAAGIDEPARAAAQGVASADLHQEKAVENVCINDQTESSRRAK